MKKIAICLITLITFNTTQDLHAGKKRKKIKREDFHTWAARQPEDSKLHKAIMKQVLFAVAKKNWGVLHALTKNNPNYQCLFDDTPLHYAVRNQHTPTIAWAIENGADPTITNMYSQTPLTIAALNNDIESARILLSKKPQDLFIETIATQIKPNRHAKRQQKYLLNTIDFMVKNKLVDINKTDGSGHTPLHTAIKTDNTAIAKYLISAHNIKLNQKDSWLATPLHYAIILGQPDIVKSLITTKANIDILDNDQNSPLDLATQTATSITPIGLEKHHLYKEIVAILIKHNARFNSLTVLEEKHTKSSDKKINPNTKPCPSCGSDKKYKQCCGNPKRGNPTPDTLAHKK